MTEVLEKIKSLEKEVLDLKKFLGVIREDVDYKMDEKNYEKIKKDAKKIRMQLIKERYPKLYARISKKS